MNILTEVQSIFRDVFDDENLVVTEETSANDIDDWDSFAHINLVIAMEKHFKVRFALGETQALKNVGGMVELIASKIQ